ncbi:hypothetical protein M8818_003787 [Zalaria obscura]|uniref:Uncharacterized protein n=1 Tax=Zalaria obscura TaxID=2024903 RepID=A0ACC3SFD3_9PEZI
MAKAKGPSRPSMHRVADAFLRDTCRTVVETSLGTRPTATHFSEAGIGGLSACISIHRAGHNVSLLESAKELREIGAGVLISPNATRELIKWGLDDELHDLIVHSRVSRVLRWKDGAVLSEVAIDPDVIQKKYGAPTWTVHRADLHQGLIRKVKQLGIPIRLGSKVIEADVDSASVTISTGEVFQCDFIVGADGVRSKLRDILCGQPTPAQPTGDYAFQFALDIDKHRDDPVIGRLTREKAATAWWGGGRHHDTETLPEWPAQVATGRNTNPV